MALRARAGLNYPQLFKSTEVELVHGDDARELTDFEEQIDQLCRESSPVKQLEAMGPEEIDKIPREVLEKAVERALA